MKTTNCKKCKHLRKKIIYKPTRGRDYICNLSGKLLCKGAGHNGDIFPVKEVECLNEAKRRANGRD